MNDVRLTLGDGNKMKLGVDPFPVGMVNLEEKKIWCILAKPEQHKEKM
jgi:hypothetical protein